jgi:hypothetical protein
MDIKDLGIAAIGSIIGFKLRELINVYHKKVEFERNLMNLTYKRKLEVAEKAVSYFF